MTLIERRPRRPFRRTVFVAGQLGLIWSLGACAHQAAHEHSHVPRDLGTIHVAGMGEAHGAPDVARSTIGIEARAPSVQEAMRQANAYMVQITQALKGQGVDDANLQTQGFSVTYDREYVQPAATSAAATSGCTSCGAMLSGRGPLKKSAAVEAASPPVEVTPAPAAVPAPRGSYVVSNRLQVTVRDVSKLGDVLSAATAAGANHIWGISFDLADKSGLVEQARAQAMERAKRDAERIAALSGVKLGKLLRVSDSAGGPAPLLRASYAAEAMPVERGELSVAHSVSLEYAIAE